MSGIDLEFGDGTYNFRLSWAACAEIERKSDASIQVIYARLMVGEASTSDIVETIRQGLICGSGGMVDGQPIEMKPHIANALIERYVVGLDARPIQENWNIARVVMSGAMVGYPDAQKKSEPESQASTTE